ncbi:uncharacterized protein LOC142530084 [Primulina tabacum]|uniref:uncharacterized protein LOC142530084 n=1 Tax=Primulina tabacum TaxID=48773 RepID=UPI003F5A8C55
MFYQIKPDSVRYGLGLSDHDGEWLLVTVEFVKFYLLCGYVPNSGDGLKRLIHDIFRILMHLFSFLFFFLGVKLIKISVVKSYRITQWDPSLSNYMKGNKRSAGFTDEERQSFQTNFLDKGFIDTFRKQPLALLVIRIGATGTVDEKPTEDGGSTNSLPPNQLPTRYTTHMFSQMLLEVIIVPLASFSNYKTDVNQTLPRWRI